VRTHCDLTRACDRSHIAFSVSGLERALAPLERDGVKVLQRPQPTAGGQLQSAFIAAPDGVELELVEAATPN
jgi:catechol 2,3-dioxygenase-like lactoylglutathione lyase family enzyme